MKTADHTFPAKDGGRSNSNRTLVENNLLPETFSKVEKSYNSYLPSANVEVCSYFNVWKDGFLEINKLKATLIWSHFLGGHLYERLT